MRNRGGFPRMPLSSVENLTEEIDKLGYRLTRFVRACNQLYRFSVSGRQPSWIAELLDRGKPANSSLCNENERWPWRSRK